jgi:hypothetical protein
MSEEESKKAWRTVLTAMEPTDTEEILSYVIPSKRTASRWIGLRDEKLAKESMVGTANAAGDAMPLELVLLLVDHWAERKRTVDDTESASKPVLATAVIDAALSSMARKDTVEQTERALRRAIKEADKEGPDKEARSPFGKALLELPPTSSKLGEVASTGKYNGMGHVEGELGVEPASPFWQRPAHRVSRQAFRQYLRKLMLVCKQHQRRHLAERIADVLTFLDSIPSWNVAYVYIDKYMDETNGTFAYERIDKCYLDAWMQVYGSAMPLGALSGGGPAPAAGHAPAGAASARTRMDPVGAREELAPALLAPQELDLLTKLAKQPAAASGGYEALSGGWMRYALLSDAQRSLEPAPEALQYDALSLFDPPGGEKGGAPPPKNVPAEGGGVEKSICYNCKRPGHLSRDCPELSESERQVKRAAAEAAAAARAKEKERGVAMAEAATDKAAKAAEARALAVAAAKSAKADKTAGAKAQTAAAKKAGLEAAAAAKVKPADAGSPPMPTITEVVGEEL